MSTTEIFEAPPEVEATLTRLIAHKNVRGILILARPTGIIIRSTGSLFISSSIVPPPASSSAPIELDGEAIPALNSVSAIALKYAGMAQRIVESLGGEIGDCESGDELKFLRIRTKKHELLITPDSLYILVVVQDPSI